MPTRAICIRCGESKGVPYEQCRHCEFDPSQIEDDLVKSVYLSLGRYEDDADIRRYEGELVLMGRALREGGELRTMTTGRGQFSMEFLRYSPCPRNIADDVIAKAKEREAARNK